MLFRPQTRFVLTVVFWAAIALPMQAQTARVQFIHASPYAEVQRKVLYRGSRRSTEQLRARYSTEIAYSVGFKSAAHFSAVFKKQYGKSPSEHVDSDG